MTTLILALSLLHVSSPQVFADRLQVQGLYDELSQATLAFRTPFDIDVFHPALYAPDWTFIDANGASHTWQEMRGQEMNDLMLPTPDSITETVRTLTPTRDGITAVVDVATVRDFIDSDGEYGRPGLRHFVTETETFRDVWAPSAGDLKLQSRQQLGQPILRVDRITAK